MQKSEGQLNIKWKTNNEYYDVDTGDQLTEEDAKLNYIIIKRNKNVKISNTHGVITYTNECRKSPQLKLF